MEITKKAIENIASFVATYGDIYVTDDGQHYLKESQAILRQETKGKEVPSKLVRYVRCNISNKENWKTPEKLWELFDKQYIEQLSRKRNEEQISKKVPNRVISTIIDPEEAYNQIFNEESKEKESKEEFNLSSDVELNAIIADKINSDEFSEDSELLVDYVSSNYTIDSKRVTKKKVRDIIAEIK